MRYGEIEGDFGPFTLLGVDRDFDPVSVAVVLDDRQSQPVSL